MLIGTLLHAVEDPELELTLTMAAPPAADVPSFASPSHVAVSHETSIKLTRGHSCVLCQQRKVRCDKNKPCANCVKAGVECKVVPPQPPRRRKKKPHERDLIDRLKKYETLLSQHGVDFEPIGHSFRSSDPASVDDIDDIEHGSELPGHPFLSLHQPVPPFRSGGGFVRVSHVNAPRFSATPITNSKRSSRGFENLAIVNWRRHREVRFGPAYRSASLWLTVPDIPNGFNTPKMLVLPLVS